MCTFSLCLLARQWSTILICSLESSFIKDTLLLFNNYLPTYFFPSLALLVLSAPKICLSFPSFFYFLVLSGFSGGPNSKESTCNAGDMGSIPGLGRKSCNPLQSSCLDKPHGPRSLTGYSPWDRRESDTTEQLNTAQHFLLCAMPQFFPLIF